MADSAWENKLYCGDNVNRLRGYVACDNVGLIYLGPRLDASATHNVLFQEKNEGKPQLSLNLVTISCG